MELYNSIFDPKKPKKATPSVENIIDYSNQNIVPEINVTSEPPKFESKKGRLSDNLTDEDKLLITKEFSKQNNKPELFQKAYSDYKTKYPNKTELQVSNSEKNLDRISKDKNKEVFPLSDLDKSEAESFLKFSKEFKLKELQKTKGLNTEKIIQNMKDFSANNLTVDTPFGKFNYKSQSETIPFPFNTNQILQELYTGERKSNQFLQGFNQVLQPYVSMSNTIITGLNKLGANIPKIKDPAFGNGSSGNVIVDEIQNVLGNVGGFIFNIGTLGESVNLLNSVKSLNGIKQIVSKSPIAKDFIYSGLKFAAPEISTEIDNIINKNKDVKESAFDIATSFTTGGLFGLNPFLKPQTLTKGGISLLDTAPPLRNYLYSGIYQALIPSSVPQFANNLKGNPVDLEQFKKDVYTNIALELLPGIRNLGLKLKSNTPGVKVNSNKSIQYQTINVNRSIDEFKKEYPNLNPNIVSSDVIKTAHKNFLDKADQIAKDVKENIPDNSKKISEMTDNEFQNFIIDNHNKFYEIYDKHFKNDNDVDSVRMLLTNFGYDLKDINSVSQNRVGVLTDIIFRKQLQNPNYKKVKLVLGNVGTGKTTFIENYKNVEPNTLFVSTPFSNARSNFLILKDIYREKELRNRQNKDLNIELVYLYQNPLDTYKNLLNRDIEQGRYIDFKTWIAINELTQDNFTEMVDPSGFNPLMSEFTEYGYPTTTIKPTIKQQTISPQYQLDEYSGNYIFTNEFKNNYNSDNFKNYIKDIYDYTNSLSEYQYPFKNQRLNEIKDFANQNNINLYEQHQKLDDRHVLYPENKLNSRNQSADQSLYGKYDTGKEISNEIQRQSDGTQIPTRSLSIEETKIGSPESKKRGTSEQREQSNTIRDNKELYNKIVKSLSLKFPDVTPIPQDKVYSSSGEVVRGKAVTDGLSKIAYWSLQDGTLDTAPHEYAHFYIDMFENSDVVQDGIKLFGDKESLVEFLGNDYVKRSNQNIPQRFLQYVKDFWTKIKSYFVDLKPNDLEILIGSSFYKGKPIKKLLPEQIKSAYISVIEQFQPWEDDFPQSIVSTTINKLKSHPLYPKAKKGDYESAIIVINDLIKKDRYKVLKNIDNAVLVPIISNEIGGNNAIPFALAKKISDDYGIPLDENIQIDNKVHHTNSNMIYRLLFPPQFRGDIIPGKKYIIVDDVVTSGNSIRNLKDYIERNGGKVVHTSVLGASFLTSYSANLKLSDNTKKLLETKFDIHEFNKLIKTWGIANDYKDLTNAEAQYFSRFSSIDSIREKIEQATIEFLEQNTPKNQKPPDEQLQKIQSSETTNLLKSNIDFNYNPKEKFEWTFANLKNKAHTLYQKVLDKGHSIKRISDSLNLSDVKNPYLRYRLYPAINDEINSWIDNKRIVYDENGNIQPIGKGLKEIIQNKNFLTEFSQNFDKLKPLLDSQDSGLLSNPDFVIATYENSLSVLERIKDGQLQTTDRKQAELNKTIIESLLPTIKDVHNDLQQYNHDLLHKLDDILGVETVNKLIESRPDYASLERAFNKFEQTGDINYFLPSKNLNSYNPVNKSVGNDTLKYINPLESLIKNTYLIIDQSRKNEITKLTGETLLQLPDTDFGGDSIILFDESMFDKPDENIFVNKPHLTDKKSDKDETLKSLYSQLSKLENLKENLLSDNYKQTVQTEINITKQKISDIHKSYYNYTKNFIARDFADSQKQEIENLKNKLLKTALSEEYTIRYRDNGKLKIIKVNKDIFESINNLPPIFESTFKKVLKLPNDLIKFTATSTPNFTIPNFIRDQWSAYINTGQIPFYPAFRGIFHLLKKDDVFKNYMLSGGRGATFVTVDRDFLKQSYKILKSSEYEKEMDFWSKSKNYLTVFPEIIKLFPKFNEMIELGTRIGNFEMQKNKGLSDLRAAFESRESTVDFQRQGSSTFIRAVNEFLIPFFNARLQGTDKLFRTLIQNPKSGLLRALPLVAGTLFFNILNSEDEYYKEKPDWEKQLYWLVPRKISSLLGADSIIGDEFIKIPKGDVGYIFGTFLDQIISKITGNDTATLEQMLFGLFENLNPSGDVSVSTVIPPVLKPVIEISNNKSFFTGSPISFNEQYNIDVPAEFDYNINTSETFKKLGENLGMSPAKLQHIYSSFTTDLGRMSLNILDDIGQYLNILNKTNELPLTIGEKEILRRFITKPQSPGKSITIFFQNYKDSKKIYNSVLNLKKSGYDDKLIDSYLQQETNGTKNFDLYTHYHDFEYINDSLKKNKKLLELLKDDEDIPGDMKFYKMLDLYKQNTEIVKDKSKLDSQEKRAKLFEDLSFKSFGQYFKFNNEQIKSNYLPFEIALEVADKRKKQLMNQSHGYPDKKTQDEIDKINQWINFIYDFQNNPSLYLKPLQK